MPNTRLTDVAIKSLKPPLEGQITYWDETLPSFGVRVSQGGTKSFVLVYGEARTRKTLGRYLFSPGIFWSGLSLNRSGWEVQHLQMNS